MPYQPHPLCYRRFNDSRCLVPVAAPSRVLMDFDRPITEFVALGMNIYQLFFCFVLSYAGRGLVNVGLKSNESYQGL
jgi:hypothetical protein